jgi:hypothetical protein
MLERVPWETLFERPDQLLTFITWFSSLADSSAMLAAGLLRTIPTHSFEALDAEERAACEQQLVSCRDRIASVDPAAADHVEAILDSIRRGKTSADDDVGNGVLTGAHRLRQAFEHVFRPLAGALVAAARQQAATALAVAVADLDAAVEHHTSSRAAAGPSTRCLALHTWKAASVGTEAMLAVYAVFREVTTLLMQTVMTPTADVIVSASATKMLATIALHRLDSVQCEHMRNLLANVLALPAAATVGGMTRAASAPSLTTTIAQCRMLDFIAMVCDRDIEGATIKNLLWGPVGSRRGENGAAQAPIGSVFRLCTASAAVGERTRLCAMNALGMALARAPQLVDLDAVGDLAVEVMRVSPDAPAQPRPRYHAGKSVVAQSDPTLAAMTRVACGALISHIAASPAADPQHASPQQLKRLYDLASAMASYTEKTGSPRSRPPSEVLAGESTDELLDEVPIDTEALIRAHGQAAVRLLHGEDPGAEDGGWATHPLNLWRRGGLLAASEQQQAASSMLRIAPSEPRQSLPALATARKPESVPRVLVVPR